MPKQIPASKLDKSIHILNTLLGGVNTHLTTLVTIAKGGLIDGELLHNIHILTYNNGLIAVASYLDEINDFFIPALNPAEANSIMPYISRIKTEIDRFTDIKKYRNHVLAHNLRKNNKNIYLKGHLRDYKVPQNLEEYMFLCHLLNLLTEKINEVFPGAYDRVLDEVRDAQENIAVSLQPVLSEADIKSILSALDQDLINIPLAV